MNRTPLVCALILVLADVAKPVVVDDPAYILFARQIAESPAHMYGPPPEGALFHWYQHPSRAFEILCPPVVPCWLALGISLFGESVPLLKLSMFPFAYLFAWSVHRLFRWLCAAPSSQPARSMMVAATVLSPAFLPALNLMLDIPAIGLGLAGVAVFVGGLPIPRWWRGALAGVLIGLAMQTKYSTLLMPAVVALMFFGYGRRVLVPAALCAAAAGLVFVAWEYRTFEVYGRSHFAFHSADQPWDHLKFPPETTWTGRAAEKLSLIYEEKVKLVVPLLSQLGLLAPGSILLAWLALGMTRRWLAIVGIGWLAFGAVGLAAIPIDDQIFTRDEAGLPRMTFTSVLVTVWLSSMAVASIGILGRLHVRGWSIGRPRLRFDRIAVVLTLWLGLEIFGYFMLTPFPASRRLMGPIVVLSLLVGRLLLWTVRSDDSLRTMRMVTVAGLIWASLFAVTDIVDARIEEVVPRRVANAVRAVDPEAKIWFCGHWGTQYYGERAGMEMVVPDETNLRRGDYLAVPGKDRPAAQEILIPWANVELVGRVDETAYWPLKTIPGFYGGNLPLQPHEGPRMSMEIYRVVRGFVPETDPAIYE